LNRAHYQASIRTFISAPRDAIVGALARESVFAVEPAQLAAWLEQVDLLQEVLAPYADRGEVFFEFVLPRLGRRIDVLLILVRCPQVS